MIIGSSPGGAVDSPYPFMSRANTLNPAAASAGIYQREKTHLNLKYGSCIHLFLAFKYIYSSTVLVQYFHFMPLSTSPALYSFSYFTNEDFYTQTD